MCVCVRVCVYTCIHTDIYTHTYTYIQVRREELEAQGQEWIGQRTQLEAQVQQERLHRTQLEARLQELGAPSHSLSDKHTGHEIHEQGDGMLNQREPLEQFAQPQTLAQNLQMEKTRLPNVESLKETGLESDEKEKEKEGLTAKLLERDETLLENTRLQVSFAP